MTLLLRLFSAASAILCFVVFMNTFTASHGAGGGLIAMVGLSAAGSLFGACIAFAWMASMLAEAQQSRREQAVQMERLTKAMEAISYRLPGNSSGAPPAPRPVAPSAPAKTEPTFTRLTGAPHFARKDPPAGMSGVTDRW